MKMNSVNPTNLGSLYKEDPTIAYRVEFHPWSGLDPAAKNAIVWQKSLVLKKEELLEQLSEDRTEVYFPGDSNQFRLVWEYNQVPSLSQWREFKCDALFRVQFRISPLVSQPGRIAILSYLNRRGESL